LNEGVALLCGLDEAGRGPLAGPVCAAAVILPYDFPISVLNDSKKLKAEEREKARLAICNSDADWGIGWASAAEIDKINIHKATLLAMKRAFESMIDRGINNRPHETSKIRAVVDGLFVPEINASCEAIVKADNTIPAVMAASILAKTARDRLMEHYGLFYPQYGYERHKGYPTKAHREAILRFGPSPIQRMSFSAKLFNRGLLVF
jgi:ribonuclease HII